MFNFLCKASKTTNITIGENAISSLYDILEEEKAKVFIIADIIPWGLYGKKIINNLKTKGIIYSVLTISSEDKNKNYNTFAYCISKLTENSIDKNDYIMAFGGGVTGDVAGYIASVYKRGIKYIFVPTNLLSMADSCIGGKNGLNYGNFKNIVGTVYQPDLVYINLEYIADMPQKLIENGYSEIIKHAIIGDKTLFNRIKANQFAGVKDDVKASLLVKKKYVEKDEFSFGERKCLDLGHTVSHAVESKSEYSVSHGQGVIIGIAINTIASYKNGFCNKEVVDEILGLFNGLGLTYACPYSVNDIMPYLINDKKKEGDIFYIPIIEKIGKVRVVNMTQQQLKSFISSGLNS